MGKRARLGACNGNVSKALEYARDHGWSYALTKNGHVKYSKAGRGPVFGSQTSSDNRAWKNLIRMLRDEDRKAITSDDAGRGNSKSL